MCFLKSSFLKYFKQYLLVAETVVKVVEAVAESVIEIFEVITKVVEAVAAAK